jgi:hypothetical protein
VEVIPTEVCVCVCERFPGIRMCDGHSIAQGAQVEACQNEDTSKTGASRCESRGPVSWNDTFQKLLVLPRIHYGIESDMIVIVDIIFSAVENIVFVNVFKVNSSSLLELNSTLGVSVNAGYVLNS